MTLSTFQTCNRCNFPDHDEIHPDIVSPIPELLGTNSVPSMPQVRLIDAYLRTVDKDIEHLGQHITSVKSVLNTLQNEYQDLQQREHNHHAVLAPIRRLCPEILSEIFVFCLGGVVQKRLPDVPDTTSSTLGPLLLTRICSSWRAVALDTPELWTTIRVVIHPCSHKQDQLTRLWLTRSKSLPLTIAILDSRRKFSLEKYMSGKYVLQCNKNPALRALLDQCHRWENVYFSFPSISGAWDTFSRIRDHLGSVRHISFNSSRENLENPDPFVIDYFENLPKIQHVSMDYGTAFHGTVHSDSKLMVKLPYDQITSLSILLHGQNPISTEACIETIHCLPNLQKCIVHCGRMLDPTWQPPHQILPHLRALVVIAEDSLNLPDISTLGIDPEDGLSTLFSSLTLPALERLTLSLKGDRIWNHEHFSTFLTSSPNITFFELMVTSETPIPYSFMTALEKLSEVRHLIIHGFNFSYHTSLMENLTLQYQHPSIYFKELRKLELRELESHITSGLVEILLSRTLRAEEKHVFRLEFLNYEAESGTATDFSEETRTTLDGLVNDRLQIQLSVKKTGIFASPGFRPPEC